jgi:1-phosphofructokinase family hexose kinase
VNSVIVLALNPSIDAEWRVDDVLWEEKNNVMSEMRWAGGKGINVARWLNHFRCKTKLILPLGGLTGKELAGYLQKEKLSAQIITLRQATRVNVIVTTKRGRQMRFNPLGPELSAREMSVVLQRVKDELPQSGLLILTGSLPRGVAVSTYQKLIQLAHRHGVKTLLDCDGTPFAAAINARPFLVKPNEHELAQWFGKPLRTEKEILQAARKLSATTKGWVLVSRGGKRCWLVNMSEAVEISATPPRIKPRNTVGAGDALLAAVANQITLGKSPTNWLRCGIETGTAATQLQAGTLPAR